MENKIYVAWSIGILDLFNICLSVLNQWFLITLSAFSIIWIFSLHFNCSKPLQEVLVSNLHTHPHLWKHWIICWHLQFYLVQASHPLILQHLCQYAHRWVGWLVCAVAAQLPVTVFINFTWPHQKMVWGLAYSPGGESAGHSIAMQRWPTHTLVSGSWGHSKKADLGLHGRGHLIWALSISKWSGQGNRCSRTHRGPQDKWGRLEWRIHRGTLNPQLHPLSVSLLFPTCKVRKWRWSQKFLPQTFECLGEKQCHSLMDTLSQRRGWQQCSVSALSTAVATRHVATEHYGWGTCNFI